MPRSRAFCNTGRVTDIYLEVGKRKVFACALDWPGWCRAARTEDAAVSALAAAAQRYAPVCELAGIAFDASSASAGLEVVARVAGSATTDFGALDAPASGDSEPMTAQDAARLAALAQAAWLTFGRIAGEAPAEIRKGPRGGGRDLDDIVDHVLQTEVLHATMLGLRHRPFPSGNQAAADRVRADIIAAILSGPTSAGPPEGAGRGRRPARFVARRSAWHALDHGWEIQDRS
jgi:hypothetical protein